MRQGSLVKALGMRGGARLPGGEGAQAEPMVGSVRPGDRDSARRALGADENRLEGSF